MSENLEIKNGDEREQFAFVQNLEATIKQDTNEIVLRNPKDNRSVKLKAKFETEMQIKSEFENLVKAWKKTTVHYSFIRQKIVHPAYLRIIGMGEKAIPLILEELKERPSASWFPALEAISGNNAVQAAENIDEAVQSWLTWGKQKNYLRV
jgi:hypothetical protein